MSQDAQSFDEFAMVYERASELTDQPAWPSIAETGVKAGGRLLDAGCGAGRRCVEFAGHFDEVVGIDLSAPLVEIARAKRAHERIRYLVTDVNDFADDEGFDVVYSHTMLHHVPDLEASLKHLKSLVRRGGFVFLEDCVAPRPTPPKWVYRAGAIIDFPKDVRKYGWRDAGFLFKFRSTGPWLEHLATDRYLSPAQFREQYGAVFEGASFPDKQFGTCIWRNTV